MNAQDLQTGYDEKDTNGSETTQKKAATENVSISNVRVNESVGAMFLGTLAILLLIFLVRANRRNRELLLEVISLKK